MRTDKRNRALQAYRGFAGHQTVTHIESNITAQYPTASQELTGRQYGLMMAVANQSYHDGKSRGLEIVDDCVYIDGAGLIPMEILRQIKIMEEQQTKTVKSDNPAHSYNWHSIYRDPECTQRISYRIEAQYMDVCYYQETTHRTTYTLDAQEVL